MRLLNVMLVTSTLAAAPACLAQTPAAAQDMGPKVGEMAPDFTLPASTKDGMLATPIHLADLKGQVVVLAFFPRARTAG